MNGLVLRFTYWTPAFAGVTLKQAGDINEEK